MNKFVLFFTKITGFPMAKLFFKWKVIYRDRAVQDKKLKDGVILMSNHKALLDFVLYLNLFFRAPVHFLMAEVLFNKNAAFSWLLYKLGGIRVNRETYDFSFIEESVQILKKGGIMGIFPEGQLPRGGKMSRFTPSLVMIALASGADIVPVYTDGNYGIGKRATVVIGTPFKLKELCPKDHPEKEDISRCNELCLEKILELQELAK
ncbi:MAG: 1-acyl-sn-glycerol-3-phosphate acyltransferase [Parasporobacterium sp.]|nr:1-acyl-sn-glycerol-3-phosphate acyltransferase [Parasporobacterium sp.]